MLRFVSKGIRIALIYLSLAVATFISFWNVTHSNFINYDDPRYITGNVHIQKGITLRSIRWAFTTGYESNWHPLTWISHMIDFQFFGLNPAGAHIVNLLFHIANVLLLFYVLNLMTTAVWKSAFVAALFALHPLHVQSVAWAAERKDVLSTFFWMLTMIAYCRYVRRPQVKRYLLIILFFALGLMSKPMLVTLPLVLLLLDYWPLRRFDENSATKRKITGQLVLEKAPLFILSALSCIVTYIAQQRGGAVQSLAMKPLGLRIANATVSYIVYIWKALWPDNLAVFYPYPKSLPDWQAAGAGLLLCAISIAVVLIALRGLKRHGYLAVGWFWYLVTLAPVIGIVQVGRQARADRYTYIPLTGLFIIAAWGLPELLEKLGFRGKALIALAVPALACLAVITWQQVSYWQSSTTLFGHAIKVTDENDLAYYNHGVASAASGNYSQAIFDYKNATRINPLYFKAFCNLGATYATMGDYAQAVRDYDRAIEIQPGKAVTYNDRGAAYYSLGNNNQAILDYNKAVALDPGMFQAYYNRGKTYMSFGRYVPAYEDFSRAIYINPEFAPAYFRRGIIMDKLGHPQRAVSDMTAAARLGNRYAQAFLFARGENW